MTRISQDGIYILICVGITLFVIMIFIIKSFVEDYFKYRRRNRIIPLQTLNINSTSSSLSLLFLLKNLYFTSLHII